MLSPDLVVASNEGNQKVKDQVVAGKGVSTDAKAMRGATETPASILQEAGKGPKQAKQSLAGVTSKLSFSGAVTKTKQDSNAKDAKVTPAKASGVQSTKKSLSNDDTLIHSPSEAILTNKKNVGLSIVSNSGEGNDLRGTAQPNSDRRQLKAKRDSSAEANNVLDEAKRQLDFNEASMTPVSKDNSRAVETGEGDTESPVRTSPRLRSSAKKKKQKKVPKNSVRSGTKRTIKGAPTKEPAAAGKTTIQQEGPPMEKGDTVSVLSRTWPGVNKPGGAGRIWKVNEDGTYDIKYLLGGSERSVERQYITLTNLVSIAVERKRRPEYIRS